MNCSKLALGAVQFGMNYGVSNSSGQTSLIEVTKILNLAHKLNISLIDSAISYGSSEKILGEIGVSNFDIVSKLPSSVLTQKEVSSSIQYHIDNSLIRLKKDSLYGFLAHNAADLLSSNGEIIYKSLNLAKKNGLIKKIGVSVYYPEEIKQLMYYYDLDLIQAPFNIIDNRLIKSGLMKELSSSNIELHVRSIFLQGLLLMTPSNRLLKFNKWVALWNTWDEWLNDLKITPIEACLSYALSFDEISKLVIGVESAKQLQEIANIKPLKSLNLPEDLVTEDQLLLNPANWNNL